MKKIKYFTVLSLATIFFLSGCLKDNTSPGSENYGNSPALVGFQYTGFAFAPGIASILPQPNDTFAIEVTLSVKTQTLSTTTTVNIAPDVPTLTAYNADSTQSTFGTTFLQLPDSEYTIVGGTAITIPAGKNMVTFNVLLAGNKIDFTKPYALALKITSATGALIATNLSTYVILVKLKSPYAGNYTGSGARLRYGTGTATGTPMPSSISGTIPFGTVSVNEIDGQLADAGSGYNMALLVHSTGTAPYAVDVLPDPLNPSTTPSAINSGTTASGGKGSTYDPTTKTFTLHFSYLNGAGALREVDETLVAQ